jgi:hypothetical protein
MHGTGSLPGTVIAPVTLLNPGEMIKYLGEPPSEVQRF